MVEKIKGDNEISEQERNNYLKDLKELYKFKYDEEDVVPTYFLCPLSNKMMLDPYITKYGNTFDKDSLFEYV